MRVSSAAADVRIPEVGQPAPAVAIINAADGAEYCLSELWRHGPAVLVFLRHAGCTFCREQVAQLRAEQARFERYSATVGLITLGRPQETDEFCRERNLSKVFVCLSDTEKLAYGAYSLARVSAGALITPNVIARGFQAVLHGHLVGMPKGDPLQMPGLFVVDVNGRVAYAHRHRDAADNPPNEVLFEVLESLKG